MPSSAAVMCLLLLLLLVPQRGTTAAADICAVLAALWSLQSLVTVQHFATLLCVHCKSKQALILTASSPFPTVMSGAMTGDLLRACKGGSSLHTPQGRQQMGHAGQQQVVVRGNDPLLAAECIPVG